MRFIATLILVLASDAAAAQSQTFKNANGQIVGRSVTNNIGTQYYDASGRNTGRSTTNNTGTTYYNHLGQRTGTARSK
jgi:hypothetical protein